MTRLERAKTIFNEKVNNAKPSIAEPLFAIKENILCTIYYDVFEENPTEEENEWFNSEMDEVSVYINTEYF